MGPNIYSLNVAAAESILPYESIVLSYSPTEEPNYESLQEYVKRILPKNENYEILVEPYSGPIAIVIAATDPSNLKAIVLCYILAQPHTLGPI